MNFTQRSNINALQVFVTVVMGLSFKNIVQGFYDLCKFSEGVLIWSIDIGVIFTYLSAILLLIRIFHVNIRILHESYEKPKDNKGYIRINQLVDWLVVLLQTIYFAFLGLFCNNLINFRWIIMIILFIDVFWLLVSNAIKKPSKNLVTLIASSSAALNGLCLILLFIIQELYISEIFSAKISGIIFGLILIITSIIDYLINQSFYFPSEIEE
jgi:hypothetical protein